MDIVQRVKDILLDPKNTWPRIDAESATVASLYNPYLVILAAIPAVAGFIGTTMVGVGAFGFSVRVPFLAGAINLIVGYGLSLAMMYVLSLVVNALAPTFGGRQDPVSAMKVVAYGSTAGLLGGIFSIVPAAGILGLLAAIYTIYLIYLGLPAVMKCPPEKSVGYTAAVIVCGLVMGLVLAALSSCITGGAMMGRHIAGGGSAGGSGEVSIKTPQGEVKIDTAAIEAMGKRMEEAGKKAEEAAKRGDAAGATQAAAQVLGAMAGGAQRPVLAAADLKALLPEAVGDLKRNSVEASSTNMGGLQTAVAEAGYEGGNEQRLHLTITDTGGLAGLAAMAAWANITSEKESNGRVERIYKQGDRSVREEFDKNAQHAEVTLLLPNGFIVEAKGDKLSLDQLKGVLGGLNLAKLENVKAPAK
jgi:hypothetical protein